MSCSGGKSNELHAPGGKVTGCKGQLSQAALQAGPRQGNQSSGVGEKEEERAEAGKCDRACMLPWRAAHDFSSVAYY